MAASRFHRNARRALILVKPQQNTENEDSRVPTPGRKILRKQQTKARGMGMHGTAERNDPCFSRTLMITSLVVDSCLLLAMKT